MAGVEWGPWWTSWVIIAEQAETQARTAPVEPTYGASAGELLAAAGQR